ncbi:MAG: fructosamine kinase family protein [Sphingomonadales bacterium]|nr:fructosamine kinase family protein [Sphingomonadales bacterium]
MTGGAVARVEPLAGGSLSDVLLVVGEDGRKFVAKQSPSAAGEAAMLDAIRDTGVPAPEVIGWRDNWLVIAYVENDGARGAAWSDVGACLARLHRARGESYGWPADSAFGSVEICNRPAESWRDFWAERRLLCHAPHIPDDLAARVERVAGNLARWIPDAPPPALLHGDLWGGNILVRQGRLAALIDPACYYGDAEVDLAMLTLLGTPASAFWDSYGDLAAGWDERRAVYQLWPALVHLRLFGEGYRPMVTRLLDRLDRADSGRSSRSSPPDG